MSRHAAATTPRSAPENRMGDALTGRTLAGAAGAAQGRDRGADSRSGIPPAECREWALGCGRYPALATVGASPSPSAALAAAPGTSGELNGGTPPSVRASANTDPQPRAPSKTASSPSAAMQPVRSSGEPDRGQSPSPAAPVTGNSSAIPKGSIRGVGSWMPERFGADYLALPEGAGVRVKLCGAARCVVMTSNDAGPSLAMQRKGRIVDLSAALFKAITGLPLSRGIAWVTVRRIE